VNLNKTVVELVAEEVEEEIEEVSEVAEVETQIYLLKIKTDKKEILLVLKELKRNFDDFV
jgi:hypothetical protein